GARIVEERWRCRHRLLNPALGVDVPARLEGHVVRRLFGEILDEPGKSEWSHDVPPSALAMSICYCAGGRRTSARPRRYQSRVPLTPGSLAASSGETTSPDGRRVTMSDKRHGSPGWSRRRSALAVASRNRFTPTRMQRPLSSFKPMPMRLNRPM